MSTLCDRLRTFGNEGFPVATEAADRITELEAEKELLISWLSPHYSDWRITDGLAKLKAGRVDVECQHLHRYHDTRTDVTHCKTCGEVVV